MESTKGPKRKSLYPNNDTKDRGTAGSKTIGLTDGLIAEIE